MAPTPAQEQGFENFFAPTPANGAGHFPIYGSDSFWSKFCWYRLRSSSAPYHNLL